MFQTASLAVLAEASPHAWLLVRRLRELGVHASLYPLASLQEQLPDSVGGLILTGAPTPETTERPALDPAWWQWGLPLLAIGPAAAWLIAALGGECRRGPVAPHLVRMASRRPSGLLAGLALPCEAWSDRAPLLAALPEGWEILADDGNGCTLAAADASGRQMALMIRPEDSRSPCGRQLLTNFAVELCGCARDWGTRPALAQAETRLREHVGDRPAIILCSGGVGSNVAAALATRTLGHDRITALHLDHGLLRQGESDEVLGLTQAAGLGRGELVDVRQAGLAAIAKLARPASREAALQGHLPAWARMTVSYSRTGDPVLVSGHHAGTPAGAMAVVQPFADLLRDEVMAMGRLMGLGRELIMRPPFPPSGLSHRCLGPLDERRLHVLGIADALFRQELRRSGREEGCWQLAAVLVPDAEREDLLVLRAVRRYDELTVQPAHLPWDAVAALVARLRRALPDLGPIVYEIDPDPAQASEWR